jgi:hypothetical protein
MPYVAPSIVGDGYRLTRSRPTFLLWWKNSGGSASPRARLNTIATPRFRSRITRTCVRPGC